MYKKILVPVDGSETSQLGFSMQSFLRRIKRPRCDYCTLCTIIWSTTAFVDS